MKPVLRIAAALFSAALLASTVAGALSGST